MQDAKSFKAKFIDTWKETPLVEEGGIFFKLENQNPTGSIKDRGLPNQIYHLLLNNQERAVISSSGNAAISASYFAQQAGIELFVYVPRTMQADRLQKLLSLSHNVTITDHAIAEAEEFSKRSGYPLIRQSVDKNAREGYTELTHELVSQFTKQGIAVNGASLFFPVSSGTAVSGFYMGLDEGEKPQLHIVQTASVQTIAGEFDASVKRKARSIVKGIVARKKENTYYHDVVTAVKETKGSGWVVTDDEVESAESWLLAHEINSSNEGALALAGLFKAQKNNYELGQTLVVIIT